MALNTEALEKDLGLEVGTIANAIASEETVSIDLSGKKIMNSSDYQTLQDNHNKELEDKKTYSHQVGYEEGLKKVVRGVLPEDFQGRKDPEKIIEAIKALKAEESGFKPDEQLSEALKKVEAYELAISNKDKEILKQKDLYEETVSKYKQKEDLSFIDSMLKKEFGKYSDKATLSESDLLALYKLRTNLKRDGETVSLFDGEDQMKDEFRNPLKLEDHFESFVQDYIKKPKGGRAGNEEGQSLGKMTVDKFEKAWRQANPNGLQSDFNLALTEQIQKGGIEM